MAQNKKKLIVIAGPTAVGKTKYSIELAKKINGEIISLDSMQVYKGLDIGTGKATKEEMQGIKHYMIDVVDPDKNLNIKEFKDMATKCIDEVFEKGKTPILVGGTGFYIRAILYDTDFLEEDEEEAENTRKELYKLLDDKGIDYIYEELKKVDPESINRIPKGNEKRVIRALEFYKLHRFPISEHNDKELSKNAAYNYDFYVLTMDRDKLYDKIGKRVDKMVEDGLLSEVKSLVDKGLSKDFNSMKSIGYSELYDFCKTHDDVNEKNFDENTKKEFTEIIENIKMHTRNYAKRQMTWFRSQKNVQWITKNQ